MPVIDGKEYPRLEQGVVLYGPPVKAEPKEKPKTAPKKKARVKKAD